MGRSLCPVEDAIEIGVGIPIIASVVGGLFLLDHLSFRQNRWKVLASMAGMSQWAFEDEIIASVEGYKPSPITSTVVDLWRKGLVDRSMHTHENPNTGTMQYGYKINKRGMAKLGLVKWGGCYEPLSPRGSTARRLEQVLRVLRDLGRECTAEGINRNVNRCGGVSSTRRLLENLASQRLVRVYPGDPVTYKINAWGLGWLKRNASTQEV